MTGPRRPPARGGATTLGPPPERPVASERPTRTVVDRKAPAKPPAVRTGGKAKVGTKVKASATAGGTKSASAAARANRSSDRSTSRAMSRVDGPRGRRDGAGEEARRRKVRRRARIMVGVAVTVLLVGVLFVAVLPTPTFLEQRSDTARLDAELTEIQAQRADVQAEIDRLGTDAEIEAQARRSGYVQPGEEAYNVLPSPIDPIGLPETWPFTGVEEAMGVR